MRVRLRLLMDNTRRITNEYKYNSNNRVGIKPAFLNEFVCAILVYMEQACPYLLLLVARCLFAHSILALCWAFHRNPNTKKGIDT